jgi:hypothetical protein
MAQNQVHEGWRVAAGNAAFVSIPGVVKPIMCGSTSRAHLIAAAPDLLAACEAAATNLVQLYRIAQLNEDESPALKMVRAAIAKAKGEA